jgi:transposase-like protein
VAAILREEKWHTVCRLTASILKQNAYILLDELLGENIDVGIVKLLCDCVYQSGAHLNVNSFHQREKRKMFEDMMDFSNIGVFSTTIKGLKTILLLIQEMNKNNANNNSSSKKCEKVQIV